MPQVDMALATFRDIIDKYPDLKHIELQGEGEPFLNADLFRMIELAVKKNVKISIITNGSLLSSRHIAAILELPVTCLLVSVESSDPQIFHDIRGGNLSKVIDGLRALMCERNARGQRLPAVGLAVTALRNLQSQMTGIIEMYQSLSLDGGISVQPLQHLSYYAEHYTNDLRANVFSEAELKLYMTGLASNRELAEINRRRRKDGFYDELYSGMSQSRSCPWLDRGVFINVQGLVSACCTAKSLELSFGHFGQSVSTILEARNHLRQQFERRTIPSTCTGCAIAKWVASGPQS